MAGKMQKKAIYGGGRKGKGITQKKSTRGGSKSSSGAKSTQKKSTRGGGKKSY